MFFITSGQPKVDADGKPKKASGWDNWKAKKFGIPLPANHQSSSSSSSSSSSRLSFPGQGSGGAAAAGGHSYLGSADMTWQQHQQQLSQPEYRRCQHKKLTNKEKNTHLYSINLNLPLIFPLTHPHLVSLILMILTPSYFLSCTFPST